MSWRDAAKKMPPEKLKELAGLCAGMAVLVVAALALSGLLPILPSSLRLALSQLNQASNTAASIENVAFVESTPGTYYWTAPTGVTSITVRAIGGGGGGGGGYWTQANCQGDAWQGSGGGSGGINTQTVAVVPGTQYTLTVGGGGRGGNDGCATSWTPGTAGTTTSFSTLVTATGGGGGGNVSGGGSAGQPNGVMGANCGFVGNGCYASVGGDNGSGYGMGGHGGYTPTAAQANMTQPYQTGQGGYLSIQYSDAAAIYISADPSAVPSGGSTSLTWGAGGGATQCTMQDQTGAQVGSVITSTSTVSGNYSVPAYINWLQINVNGAGGGGGSGPSDDYECGSDGKGNTVCTDNYINGNPGSAGLGTTTFNGTVQAGPGKGGTGGNNGIYLPATAPLGASGAAIGGDTNTTGGANNGGIAGNYSSYYGGNGGAGGQAIKLYTTGQISGTVPVVIFNGGQGGVAPSANQPGTNGTVGGNATVVEKYSTLTSPVSVGPLASNKTYTLSCFIPGGTVAASTTVQVAPACSTASGGGATGSYPNCTCTLSGYVYDSNHNSCAQPLCSAASGGGASGTYPSCTCNTSGYVYTSSTNSCTAPLCSTASGGGATGTWPSCTCNTSPYVYTSSTNSCAAPLCSSASNGGATGTYPSCTCVLSGYTYTSGTNSCTAPTPSLTFSASSPVNAGSGSQLNWSASGIATGSCSVVQIDPNNLVTNVSAIGAGDTASNFSTPALSTPGSYTLKLACFALVTNGNNGTLVNSPTLTAGKFGQAVNLTGSNYISESQTISSLASSPASVTLSAWVKPNAAGGVVLSERAGGGGWHDVQMEIETNNTAKVCMWTGALTCVTAGSGITYGNWYHVVMTYNSSNTTLKGYLNGVAGGSAVATKQYPGSSVGYSIGESDSANGGDGSAFSGLIDDVRVYNRALSSDEISTLYNGGQITNGIVAYWPFDTNSVNGATVYDLASGVNSSSKSVTVNNLTPPLIVSFSASRVQSGSPSTLSWSVTGMQTGLDCKITPVPSSGQISWVSGSTWNGTATTNPITQSTAFTLTCGTGLASTTQQINATIVPHVIEI